jgi:hypothetical protein
METSFARVIAALDAIDGTAAVGAWAGGKQRLRVLERAVARWLNSRGTTEAESVHQLWNLFARLRSAVERGEGVGVQSAADDLRVELVALEAGTSIAPSPSAP